MINTNTCKSITDEKICKSRPDCLFTATKKCRKHMIAKEPLNLSVKNQSKSSISKKSTSYTGDPCADYTKLLGHRRDINREIIEKNKQCEEQL